MTQKNEKVTQAKNTISGLVLKQRGVHAVGTGKDQQGRDAVIIHIDPNMPDTRERIQKMIEPAATDVPIVYIESGPYRKFPAT